MNASAHSDVPLRRTFDGAFLTSVANHPEVRPWLGGAGEPVNMASAVADPENYTFQFEHGGFCFLPRGEGVYEAHYHFLPEAWGREPKAVLPGVLIEMFDGVSDCDAIAVQVSYENKRSQALLERVGFTERADLPCPTESARIYLLTRDDWSLMQEAV